MWLWQNWVGRAVRRRTRPIPEDRALLWKRRLSVTYGLVAWNAFGLIVFMCYKGKADWAHYYGLKTDEEKAVPPGRAWAQTLGIQNAKVYRVAGFSKVDEYEIIDGQEVRQAKSTENSNTTSVQKDL